ncbi:hypothetical protein B0H14DRAFT_2761623 [Mycena olivaceomarginata]|nr:hypothetical protein B0H14DRAFT_2761623 [Mycena olivaceomarginata]
MNLLKFLRGTLPGHTVDTDQQLTGGNESGSTEVRRAKPRRCGFSLRWRMAVLSTVVFLWLFYRLSVPGYYMDHFTDGDPPRRPPLYEAYHQRERNLSQHNPSLPSPDGRHAKFLWAANHVSHTDWADYMEEMILNAYLAYAAQRAYVFDNYTWEQGGYELSFQDGYAMPARIPLSAFISGPIVGGPMPDKDVPRAVSREYFLSMCPRSDTVVVDTKMIQDALAAGATANQIIERWVAKLRAIQSPCVELARYSPQLFDHKITSTARILDVFPALSQSPILSDFGWSSLILEGFHNNFEKFASPDPRLLMKTSIRPLRGLIALHIPRQNHEAVCADAYSSVGSFAGFNNLSELPDRYSPPGRDGSDRTWEITRRHCLPSIPEIVEKVLTISEPHTTRVYVITDEAAHPWLADLTAALSAAYHWPHGISTSVDLKLSREGKFVSQALEMCIGQHAEKFIGNGFSTFTSNTVLLRMNNPDLLSSDTHFW